MNYMPNITVATMSDVNAWPAATPRAALSNVRGRYGTRKANSRRAGMVLSSVRVCRFRGWWLGA